MTDRQYFDPNLYRIILYDQRGAGRSRPLAEIKVRSNHHVLLCGSHDSLGKHNMASYRRYGNTTETFEYVYIASLGMLLLLSLSPSPPGKYRY